MTPQRILGKSRFDLSHQRSVLCPSPFRYQKAAEESGAEKKKVSISVCPNLSKPRLNPSPPLTCIALMSFSLAAYRLNEAFVLRASLAQPPLMLLLRVETGRRRLTMPALLADL